ncbi:MAG TPA: hypothetical protein DCM87_17870 [Planctomycetes bacterium]|nr:hypothetical protein [Planctomycetota bacterium]
MMSATSGLSFRSHASTCSRAQAIVLEPSFPNSGPFQSRQHSGRRCAFTRSKAASSSGGAFFRA